MGAPRPSTRGPRRAILAEAARGRRSAGAGGRRVLAAVADAVDADRLVRAEHGDLGGDHLLLLAQRRVVVAQRARRAPDRVTTSWWKEERGSRIFVDFNQNAQDRVMASAYSLRARPDALVSMPIEWAEVAECDPAAFTLRTMPEIVASTTNP